MEEINLKDLFKYLYKNILLIAIVSIFLMFVTFLYSSFIKVPLYETSTTLVLVKSVDDSNSINYNDVSLNQKLVSTYSQLVKSKRVINQVVQSLKLKNDASNISNNITVSSMENTEILKISVRDKDAKLAADIANATADTFSKEVAKIYKMDNISIIDEAPVPTEIANNTVKRDVILALFAGIFITVSILFIIYYFDDTIKVSEELEEEIGLPIVGKVGLNIFDRKNNKLKSELVVERNPKSIVTECIKNVRASLSFSSVNKQLKSILITSSVPSEGKSFISANLAISFAQTNKKVLLVDCDMRKSRQHKIFKMSNTRGLSNLLIDNFKETYMDYIRPTEIKNLDILTAGVTPPNPSELLSSPNNKELIKLLTAKYDLVIFDGVPCNGLADSIIMSTLVDKTMIVCAENITPKSLILNTKKSLENVNSNIAGVIINKVNMKDHKYYSYYGESE